MTFELDPRLDNDCFKLAESEHSLWLLLNNQLFPWMVVVPKTTHTELYQLTANEQARVTAQSNLLSEFLKQEFACDKLNIASIGNIVTQMHLHVIGRTIDDPCWPGTVWGTGFKQAYKIEDVFTFQQQLQQFCQDKGITEYQFLALQDKS